MNKSKKIQKNPKTIIITGHYGAGKTNLAVNLAISLNKAGKTVAIADLDIVNPYFRTADFRELFADCGIILSASDFANTSLDVPAVNLNVRGLSARTDHLIIDVGGDGEGAKALGRFARDITELGYEMYYVINYYRYLSEPVEQAVEMLKSIEKSSGLKCTAIVNNSNLGNETTAELIAESVPFAEEVAEITKLPLVEIPVEVYVKKIWENSSTLGALPQPPQFFEKN